MNMQETPKLIFTDKEGTISALKSQITINENLTFLPEPAVLGNFKGFDGFISVASYKEALWVAPLAKIENKDFMINLLLFG